jgi:hypothetical protein
VYKPVVIEELLEGSIAKITIESDRTKNTLYRVNLRNFFMRPKWQVCSTGEL